MSADTFFDTNVCVYAFDNAFPEKRARALALLESAGPQTHAVSPQVIQEFYVTVTRNLKPAITAEVAEAAVAALARLTVVPVDAALVLAGLRRARESQLSLWDAMIVESALRAGCTVLCTEDLQDGARFGTLTVVDPFRA